MIHYQPPQQAKPDILYFDDDLLIVDKLAGLLTVPGRRPEHKDCLLSRIHKIHPEARIVHRLDMSTSGLLLLARNQETLRLLNRQFEQRQVFKTYLAVVTGQVAQISGTIELPLICDWPNRPRQIVDHANGKPAQTDFQVLSYDEKADTTRLELKPVTGRTHQLRVHLQELGHPILGDDLYADEETEKKAERLLLHASSLDFTHPVTGDVMTFSLAAPF